MLSGYDGHLQELLLSPFLCLILASANRVWPLSELECLGSDRVHIVCWSPPSRGGSSGGGGGGGGGFLEKMEVSASVFCLRCIAWPSPVPPFPSLFFGKLSTKIGGGCLPEVGIVSPTIGRRAFSPEVQ